MTSRNHLKLIGFTIALFVACIACVWRAVSGAANSSYFAGTARERGAIMTAALKQPMVSENQVQPSRNYAVIARRNLFRPFVKQEGHSQTQAPPPPSLSPLPRTPSRPPLSSPPSSPSPPDESGPEKDKVTVVGVVWSNGVTQVLVEDFGRGETKHISVGESAFGYRVAQITDDGAVLERNGREFRLAWGQGKPAISVSGIGGENVVAAQQWERLREEWEQQRAR